MGGSVASSHMGILDLSTDPYNWPMKRRSFLKGTSAMGASLSLHGCVRVRARRQTRPNVLFLMSDQHHAGCTSHAGHPGLETPHLDRLAAEGTRFERAYCQNAICVPSRHSLMTGQYPRTFGIMRNAERPAALEELIPLQSVFKSSGYTTFTAGKRHLSTPVDRDWDYAFGHLQSEQRIDTENYWDWIKKEGLLPQLQEDWNAEFGYRLAGNQAAPMGGRISRLTPATTMEAYTTRRTLAFLRSVRKGDCPFLAWSTFYRPHQPYTPLGRCVDQFDPAKVRLPENLTQPIDQLPPYFQHYRIKRDKPWNLGDAAEDHDLYRMYIAYYLALVKEIDDHIGTLLAELDRLGLAENTIVIYLYIAMFDEIDEGTAIFKCSLQPPDPGAPGRLLAVDGGRSDHYLHLTGLAGRLLRGERPATTSLTEAVALPRSSSHSTEQQ